MQNTSSDKLDEEQYEEDMFALENYILRNKRLAKNYMDE